MNGIILRRHPAARRLGPTPEQDLAGAHVGYGSGGETEGSGGNAYASMASLSLTSNNYYNGNGNGDCHSNHQLFFILFDQIIGVDAIGEAIIRIFSNKLTQITINLKF